MTAAKLSSFGGMIPAQDDRLLPEMNAALVQNCWLASGALQGFRSLQLIYTATSPSTAKVFRIPNGATDRGHLTDSVWWNFVDPDTDVVRSPVANDQWDRYYRASPSQGPMYNTRANIAAAVPDFVLGIPPPETAPGVTVSGGAAPVEARAYVYTWVSAYGEEGAPSPPGQATGNISGTWTVTLTPPLSSDTLQRNLTRTRIYRSITTSSGTAAYYFVGEVPNSTTSFVDALDDATASANNVLASTGYTPPPSDLKGLVTMPNGMIVGWRANEIWFCEPYLPHAWPVAYTLSVDFKVVGLGVVGQTLVILTEGFPYAASGINPASMALSKIATHEPCMSRASIVSTAQGVLYASPNGLMIAAFGVVENASVNLITKDKWLNMLGVQTLRSAQLGTNYYTWGSVTHGCFDPGSFNTTAFEQTDYSSAYTGALISLLDQRVAWTELTSTTPISSVVTDMWSGEIFIVISGQVFWFDVANEQRDAPYLWRSKVFETPELKNFSAVRVRFTVPPGTPAQNPIRNTNPVQVLANDQYGLLRLYADGNLVMTREIRTSGELLREPSGFKAAYWQFELEARVPIYSLEAATTVKELMQI